eukprot:TRINITY_DN2181_c0_g1_i4.p1 TRINITY_DN2181_c0_g1~~TRINITY_DN2181_c0_g1_i4.p1  ORF type:complete len:156 (+),score=30.30 TRINITY_DN2181_c0_g1_i4:122-589(+)
MQGNNIHTETREDSVVRFATTNYRVVEDYAAPSPQSGSALSRAVASSLQEMIAQGAYCMRPVVLREFESASTSGLSFLACLLQKNPSAKVPSVDSVHRFQNCILQVSRTSCDVSIVSLILLKRSACQYMIVSCLNVYFCLFAASKSNHHFTLMQL